ncbi:hypothetical protein [Streptacidiphilus albus]|uniref:hypothetical protein n=1 Tax=Streptacidiphilus albus TaxID=105425 RepID=UPI00054BE57E|nr:hypothetical protein [Streptacidiphilus albus]
MSARQTIQKILAEAAGGNSRDIEHLLNDFEDQVLAEHGRLKPWTQPHEIDAYLKRVLCAPHYDQYRRHWRDASPM